MRFFIATVQSGVATRRATVVSTVKIAAVQHDAITKFLKATEHAGFWHYIHGVWLITDLQDRSCTWWRDQIRQFVASGRLVVFQVQPETWAGHGPNAMFPWLKGHWKRRSPKPPATAE